MFCIKCGSQVDDNAPFCPNCGAEMKAKPERPAAAPVYPAYSQMPPQAYAQVKRRNITLGTRIIMIVNSVLAFLMILMPFLPFAYGYEEYSGLTSYERRHMADKGTKTYYNIFTEKKTGLSIKLNLQSKGFESIGILLMVVVILFTIAVVAGIVLSILKFKWSGFIILCGSLYHFLYSFILFAASIGASVSKNKEYGYTPVASLYFDFALAAIIFSALSLALYRTKKS